ncbi:MAG: hypothetical protein WB615_11205 [Candidatus Tumulicola sp.]
MDIHARRHAVNLYVEAKGTTSSKHASNRFGMPMTGTQLFIQVAAALPKTAELRSLNPSDEVAITLPADERLKARIARIKPVLEASRIGVPWVAESLALDAWNVTWVEQHPSMYYSPTAPNMLTRLQPLLLAFRAKLA